MTPEELIHKVAPYCIKKMVENTHKANPFRQTYAYLDVREGQEATEMEEAMFAYMGDPSEEKSEAFLFEIADRINFLMFMAGKVIGADELERGVKMEKEPRGIRNNNPGNIRLGSPWEGLAGQPRDKEFCTFESMAYGVRAMAMTLITYREKHNLKNPEQVIKRWAPAEDKNDTAAYIRHVERVVPRRLWNLQSKEALTAYIKAICTYENGVKWAAAWMPYVKEGVGMAG